MKKKRIKEGPEICPRFDKGCNKAWCPLDPDMLLRTCLNNGEKCNWMRNPSKKKVGDREFIAGGRVMPKGLLKFVPKRNAKFLNEASKIEYKKLINKNYEKEKTN